MNFQNKISMMLSNRPFLKNELTQVLQEKGKLYQIKAQINFVGLLGLEPYTCWGNAYPLGNLHNLKIRSSFL